jgi:hypothetical protein
MPEYTFLIGYYLILCASLLYSYYRVRSIGTKIEAGGAVCPHAMSPFVRLFWVIALCMLLGMRAPLAI